MDAPIVEKVLDQYYLYHIKMLLNHSEHQKYPVFAAENSSNSQNFNGYFTVLVAHSNSL